jgi:phosphopantothenoylcysteine decarboxylase/phosphopantothenate--cysteine ligase
MLEGRKIVIGITASIAAFKVPALVRLLKKEGAEIKVMMTPAALDFVTPLTLSTLSCNPVIIEPFDRKTGEWQSHVDLGRWADLYLLAPVSANTLAKMAHGVADNFFLTAYLSAKCPVFFAPAMDLDMYKHPSTRKNIEILQSYGNVLIEPTVGELASGLSGAGRMEEPENILEMVKGYFQDKEGPMTGKKVLVTAGPTHEAIDTVRFIGNHSSGLMGVAIATEFARNGAEVELVCGPGAVRPVHHRIHRTDVVSASEMHAACMKYRQQADIIVMAAAVADYTPASASGSKIKKTGDTLSLELIKTKDILMEMGSLKRPGQFVAGFALETDQEEENARKKLDQKNLDMIVLNSLNDAGAGFGSLTNKVTIFAPGQMPVRLPLKSKEDVAGDIVRMIISMI